MVGILPGAGGTISAILSYVTERRLSKHPETFGKGAIEGVAGPESANNSDTAGAMVPLLTLGIPGSSTTAILMGAFIMYGLQPGPLLFKEHPDTVWGLIDSMYLGNVMLLILNLPLVKVWVQLLRIPKPQLYAGILIFATVGAYGMRQSAFDIMLLWVIGVAGVLMRRFDFPTAPVVVGMILGPLAEAQMRNALSIGEGHWTIFVERPVSIVLVVVIVLVLALPRLLRRFGRKMVEEEHAGLAGG
jgi:putative tricarboxylic transport membrane protein